MGHESQIELWSPKLTTFCFAGFGTNRFRCQEAMKTAGRENPKRWALVPSNRAHGAVGQNNSRSIKWAAKQEKFQPKEKCFFLTSTFIELWSPKLTTFCFAGFGTNRFRCQEAMKTAGRENPKRWALVPSNRAHGAVGQNNSRSIKWAAKQEKFQPKEKCFFLTSTFIELIRT